MSLSFMMVLAVLAAINVNLLVICLAAVFCFYWAGMTIFMSLREVLGEFISSVQPIEGSSTIGAVSTEFIFLFEGFYQMRAKLRG